jgi:hypothetical protein
MLLVGVKVTDPVGVRVTDDDREVDDVGVSVTDGVTLMVGVAVSEGLPVAVMLIVGL